MRTKRNQERNADLWDVHDVCQYFGIGESTLRKRLKEARIGQSRFVTPIFGWGKRALWRADDIRNWNESDPDTRLVDSSTIRTKTLQQDRKALQKMGVLMASDN